MRFELTTDGLRNRCSTPELRRHLKRHSAKLQRSRTSSLSQRPEIGWSAETRDRTADTMIFSHVLYQLSYLGVMGGDVALPHPLADQTGFEPAISCVTGMRVKPLRYWSMLSGHPALRRTCIF